MAGELKRLVDTTRFEWMEDVEKSFRFIEFRRGLEWFSQKGCPGCHSVGGAPCKNRPCATEKKLRSCLLCGDYLTCKHTKYHCETYPFVADHYKRVAEVGLDRHLEEEEERAKAGVSIMSHLERKCCKAVKL
jgi:hypothetical protein